MMRSFQICDYDVSTTSRKRDVSEELDEGEFIPDIQRSGR